MKTHPLPTPLIIGPRVVPAAEFPPLERARITSGARVCLDAAWQDPIGAFTCLTSEHRSFQDSKPVPPECFTTMVIGYLMHGIPGLAHIAEQRVGRLQRFMRADGLFHFFHDASLIPPDADCTALGMLVSLRAGRVSPAFANLVLNRLLDNVDSDGIVATYLDAGPERRGLVDPVVCVNVLRLAGELNRLTEDRVARTIAYVREVLDQRLYVFGTRYYPSAENFLYGLAELFAANPVALSTWRPSILSALNERAGASLHLNDLAQRVAAFALLRQRMDDDARALRAKARPDGTFGADALFRYGRRSVYFGSEAASTAIATYALIKYDEFVFGWTAPRGPSTQRFA